MPTPATNYTGFIQRGGQSAFLAFASEPGGMLAPALEAADTAPTSINYIGYTGIPAVGVKGNAGQIFSAAAYRALKQTKGRREWTTRFNMEVGNYTILRYGLRSSTDLAAAGSYKGLPSCAFVGGALDQFGEGYTLAGRYALCRQMQFTFQDAPNSPVKATMEWWPLFVPETSEGSTEAGGLALVSATNAETLLATAGGEVLMWQHARWIIGGTDYRSILKSVSVTVTNTLERVNMRRDLGDDNPVSRCPIYTNPTTEEVQISLQLGDKLPRSFRNATKGATNIGQIVLEANNIDGGGSKTMTCSVANNLLNDFEQNEVAPNALLTYSASLMSSAVTIAP